jgi:transposase
MIVGLVMDQDGRPLCCELWPGNTADVTTLLPVVMTRSLYPPFSSLCKHYKLIFVIDTTWATGSADRRGHPFMVQVVGGPFCRP